jgi:phosphinothricin acetyltransferase
LIQYIDAMTLACRIANREDLEEIVAIYNSTIPSRIVTADLEPISVESRYGWFEQHTPHRRPLWVVELPHGIVGWLSLSDFYGRPAYHRTAEVSVYVRAEDRRNGVGAFLLSHAIAQSPVLAIDNLIGFIYGHNTPSLRLFERFGFVRWGELPRVCVLDGVERDVVVVGRRIGDSCE